jgi:hypothetical protein
MCNVEDHEYCGCVLTIFDVIFSSPICGFPILTYNHIQQMLDKVAIK